MRHSRAVGMKRLLVLSLALGIARIAGAQPAAVTTADYDRAVRFLAPATTPLVTGGTVDGSDNFDAEANQLLAKNLNGRLLLAHGTMDVDVPPENTMVVVDALIRANKDFDLLMIPNAGHGYGAASNYMARRRWDYFVTHLLGATPPKEYEIRTPAPAR